MVADLLQGEPDTAATGGGSRPDRFLCESRISKLRETTPRAGFVEKAATRGLRLFCGGAAIAGEGRAWKAVAMLAQPPPPPPPLLLPPVSTYFKTLNFIEDLSSALDATLEKPRSIHVSFFYRSMFSALWVTLCTLSISKYDCGIIPPYILHLHVIIIGNILTTKVYYIRKFGNNWKMPRHY